MLNGRDNFDLIVKKLSYTNTEMGNANIRFTFLILYL